MILLSHKYPLLSLFKDPALLTAFWGDLGKKGQAQGRREIKPSCGSYGHIDS